MEVAGSENPGKNSHEHGGKKRTRFVSGRNMFVDVVRVDVGRLPDAIGGGAITSSAELSELGPVSDRNRSAKIVIGVDGNSGLLNFSANLNVSLGPVGQGSAVDQGSVGRSSGVTRARAGGGDKGLT